MNQKLVETEAAEIIAACSSEILSPQDGECVVCFVERQVAEFGCNRTHRFSMHYRDIRAPRATALYTRLADMGACCCDCEIVSNAYIPAPWLYTPSGWVRDSNGDEHWHDGVWPDPMPDCAGVRKGSTQACTNWKQQRYRGRWL